VRREWIDFARKKEKNRDLFLDVQWLSERWKYERGIFADQLNLNAPILPCMSENRLEFLRAAVSLPFKSWVSLSSTAFCHHRGRTFTCFSHEAIKMCALRCGGYAYLYRHNRLFTFLSCARQIWIIFGFCFLHINSRLFSDAANISRLIPLNYAGSWLLYDFHNEAIISERTSGWGETMARFAFWLATKLIIATHKHKQQQRQ
jgi:hypothetical protein